MTTDAANPLIIAKFGGTSVADYQTMSHSADIVLSNPQIKVVVLSASAGVTNLLVALAQGCSAEQRQDYLQQIQAIQTAILQHLPVSEMHNQVEQLLNNISVLAEAASLATSTALTDEIVSHGELISSLIFSEILKSKQASCRWFDVRQVMRTHANFGKAVPDVAAIKQLSETYLRPCLAEGIVVTQGFIGSESQGKTTTLGRGGSDYTAALLGEALQAARIDIWTDVAGIYTTDPRIVPQAKRIDEIAFAEASEMATFGAKVLHPATLVPAMRSDIPVFVGSSKAPELGGTIVYGKPNGDHLPLFRAVALRRKQTLLTLHSLNMLHAQGFLAKVFDIMAKHNISVDLVTTSEVNIALTLDTASTNTNGTSLITPELLDELSQLCQVEVEDDLALIALIGNQLTATKGMTRQVFAQLHQFSIRLICYGASTHNICLLVKSQDAEEIIRHLHQTIFE